MKVSLKLNFLNLFILVFLNGAVMAQNSDKCKDKKPDVVKTGVVASVGAYGMNAAVDSNSSTATPGEQDPVIRGSIKSGKAGKCVAVVMNESECNSYSVSFSIKSTKNGGGKVQHVTSSTSTIQPRGSKEVIFSCDQKENNYSVEVTKAK